MDHNREHPQPAILIALVGLLVATLACGIGSSQTSKPTVFIISPQAGNSFAVGQEVTVQSVAADAKGVSRVELWVDGQPVHAQVVAPPATSHTTSQPWTPTTVGSHTIEVRAYNVDNGSSDPAQVIVTVAEITPGPGDTPSPLTPTGSPAAETAGGGATVTARIGLNVRSGPGVEYPVIGGLPEGQSAQITGKNPEGTWWQIVYPANSSDRGWVSAGDQYTTASNTTGVPLVGVSPLPTGSPTPTATYTPTPSATPPTPQQSKPVIYSFTADRYTVNAGESVTLHWDLGNAQAAYLRYDGVEEGVVAPGHKPVSPATTTVYTLLARNDAGETTAQLTITVNPPVAQYDLYVRRMDFAPPDMVVGGIITLDVMIATDIGPSGGPLFPASYFRWRQGPGFSWKEESCPANAQYAQCSKTLTFSYAQPGTYEVEVEADSRAEILETNESNNVKKWAITVALVPVTHSTGALDIPQTWDADLDEGVVGAGGTADIWFEAETAVQRYVTPRNGATIAVVGATSVNLSGCKSAPLSTSRININDLPEGTYVCVRTNQGRYSQFRVNAPVGPSPGLLRIGFTTWE